jgi:hypothetical protein
MHAKIRLVVPALVFVPLHLGFMGATGRLTISDHA